MNESSIHFSQQLKQSLPLILSLSLPFKIDFNCLSGFSSDLKSGSAGEAEGGYEDLSLLENWREFREELLHEMLAGGENNGLVVQTPQDKRIQRQNGERLNGTKIVHVLGNKSSEVSFRRNDSSQFESDFLLYK